MGLWRLLAVPGAALEAPWALLEARAGFSRSGRFWDRGPCADSAPFLYPTVIRCKHANKGVTCLLSLFIGQAKLGKWPSGSEALARLRPYPEGGGGRTARWPPIRARAARDTGMI